MEETTSKSTQTPSEDVNQRTPYTPDLPTIVGAAPTPDDMERQMSEAIPFHLEGLREDREKSPWLLTPEKLSPELRADFARIDAA
jgi:predicted RNase H-like HicB family nuclease